MNKEESNKKKEINFLLDNEEKKKQEALKRIKERKLIADRWVQEAKVESKAKNTKNKAKHIQFSAWLDQEIKEIEKESSVVSGDCLSIVYEQLDEKYSDEQIAIACGYFDRKENGTKIARVADYLDACAEAKEERLLKQKGSQKSIHEKGVDPANSLEEKPERNKYAGHIHLADLFWTHACALGDE